MTRQQLVILAALALALVVLYIAHQTCPACQRRLTAFRHALAMKIAE